MRRRRRFWRSSHARHTVPVQAHRELSSGGFVRVSESERKRGTRKAYPPADRVPIGYYELSTHLLALEALRRGYQLEWFHRSMFRARSGATRFAFWCTRCTMISSVAAKATIRKDVAARILAADGLSIARGRTFKVASADKARRYASRQLPRPLVVKPADEAKGRGITVDLTESAEFVRAWDLAVSTGTKLVRVERMFAGSEARFLVVDGVTHAAVSRLPPNVVGDGTSTVRELIEAKNAARKGNPHLKSRPILLDPHRLSVLARAGYNLTSVLPDGERVFVDVKGNFSTGADSIDVTDTVHPGFLEAAAAKAFPGLGIAGVDIIAQDFAEPATPDNYIVVELNSMPAIGAHHFPGVGASRNVAVPIIDFAERNAATSPA